MFYEIFVILNSLFKFITMRILHLSDLHIKRVGNKLDDAERCSYNLCNQVEVIQSVSPIDFIFITGDLVDKGGNSFDSIHDGFEVVNNIVIIPLLKITGLPKSRVILVPGNHDVEGGRITDHFDEKYPMNNESDVNWIFNEIGNESQIGKDAIARLEAYNSYAYRFAPSHLDESHKKCSPLANHFLFDVDNHKIGISCLCSPWRCDKLGETKNLVLGIRQMNEADPLLGKVDCRIALMHHDPSLIADWEKKDVKSIILKKYDVLFLGHTHLSDDTVLDNEKGRTAYCCASGIITDNIGGNNYKNGFEVIDIDIDMKSIEIRRYIHHEDESFGLDLNFGIQGVSTLKFGSRRKIYPLNNILLNSKDHSSVLILSNRLEEVKKELLNSKKQKLLIGAFSGLGKTRLVYEAALDIYRNHEDCANKEEFYYCEQSFDSEELRNELEAFIVCHREKPSVLILDNVSYDFFSYVASIMRYKNNIRIVGLTNKVLDIPEDVQDYMTITPNDMKVAVDEYIEAKIANREDSFSAKIDIKKFSHGFPMLAVALVEKYNKGENINIHDADDLLNICWNDHGQRDSQESQMLKLISLFQPFPMSEETFDAILGSKCFTSLSDLDKADKLRLRRKVINNYGNTILEVTEGGMTIRPYPLAMHLAKQWIKEYGDPTLLKELGKYIQNLDERLRDPIIECMCGRLQKMDDDPTAVALVAELTGDAGFFGDENVVCSELGSRLILAMSTVNPLAVSNVIYKVFSCKLAEEIPNMISSQTRNNLLWALRYIIFDEASFEKGIEILGKFGLAETESYSNNSRQTFIDAFHILLPGTEINLTERLRIINKFAVSKLESYRLTPLAIKGALACGHFVRTGGNTFGSGRKEDYNPTNNDVIEYWKGVIKLSIELIEEGEFLDEFADIIRTNLFMWSGRGMTFLLIPLLEAFGKKDGYSLHLSGSDWLSFIGNVERTSSTHPEVLGKVKDLYPLFIKEDFISELDAVAYQFHENVKFSFEDYWERVFEYFSPVIHKFIDNKIYENPEILKRLLFNNDVHANYFAPVLNSIITNEQLAEIWSQIYQQIGNDDELYDSTLLAYLLSSAKEKQSTEDFLEKLYLDGHHRLYIASMAKTETTELSRLSILKERYASKDFIADYLKNVNVYLSEDFLNGLFSFLEVSFDENYGTIIEFILRNHLWVDRLSDQHLDIISQMLTKIDISQLHSRDEREFWELVVHLLKKKHDSNLVSILNRKILRNFAENMHDSQSGCFYEEAFKNYIEDIWEEFAEALFGDNPSLFWHISHAICGYSLHSGMLFNLPERYLENALEKYPTNAPSRLARLCPLYDISNTESRFAKWPQYLIDHYGDRDEVLGSLSCNMGSFSCVGSVIPLYRRQIEVLMPLKKHHINKVRNWADTQISNLEQSIKYEQANEDFRRLHYEN